MGHFMAMGGYARFVWPAYGLALAVFIWNIASAHRLHARARLRAARAALARASGSSAS